MFSILHSADSQVRLLMLYVYLLNALVVLDAVFEGSFPNFSLMCQENYVHHSLLINMFGKSKNAGEKQTVLTGGWRL